MSNLEGKKEEFSNSERWKKEISNFQIQNERRKKGRDLKFGTKKRKDLELITNNGRKKGRDVGIYEFGRKKRKRSRIQIERRKKEIDQIYKFGMKKGRDLEFTNVK